MHKKFQSIAIMGKLTAPNLAEILAKTMVLLERFHLDYYLDSTSVVSPFREHPRAIPWQEWPAIDLCLVIGGDGTFLSASRRLAHKGCALLGINAGRVGFMADVPSDQLEAVLGPILQGHYVPERRRLLQVAIRRQGATVESYLALNDAVIHISKMARMIELDLYGNGEFLSHYRADGLIIATPTGSTAYALAAGGPLVEPTLPLLLAVPICPQTLAQRPLVLSQELELTVALGKTDNSQLTLDGQEESILQPHDELTIGAGAEITVIHPLGYQFHRLLRSKLNWGLSPEDGNS